MAIIRPFKAIRPNTDALILSAWHSLKNYKKLDRNPYPFLQVLHPGMGEPKLIKVKSYYQKLLSKKILVQEPHHSFYLYRQYKHGNEYLGIIGCASLDDYFSGVIRMHEQTLAEREEAWVRYLELCDFNCEPICVCYPDNHEMNHLMQHISEEEPLYDFITMDEARHTFWTVGDRHDLELIKEIFHSIPSLYIADGHHRIASCASHGKRKRETDPSYSGNENYNSFLCIFYPESQLKIYNFNRLVRDLNNLSREVFLEKLKEKFYVEVLTTPYHGPGMPHEFGMFLRGLWYRLIVRKERVCLDNPVSSLDAVILTELILAPILGIHDLRNDPRISFEPGINGLKSVEDAVNNGANQVGFVLYPASIQQVKQVADTEGLVPPKTTWIEPKQINGLIIYSLS